MCRNNTRFDVCCFASRASRVAESLTLAGVEVIGIEVRDLRRGCTLNAVNTTFASVTADLALDVAAETATFAFAPPLAAGAHRPRAGVQGEPRS